MVTSVEVKTESKKSWIVTLTTAASVLAVAGGLVNGSLQYVNEAKSRQAETELRAAKQFLETMEIAHGRGSYVWSEKCSEWLSEHISLGDVKVIDAVHQLNRALENGCSMSLPVGAATQKAEIQLLADFGIRYAFLRPAAIASLNSLREENLSPSINSVINDALRRITEDGK